MFILIKLFFIDLFNIDLLMPQLLLLSDSNVSLVIALPNEIDGLSKLEQNIEQILEPQPFRFERVDLKLPKFRIESEIQFKPILQDVSKKY